MLALKCARLRYQSINLNAKASFKKTMLEESWVLLDAEGKTLGRFASEVANILSGKNKPEYTPNADSW